MADSSKQPDEPTFDRRSADIGIVCTHNAEIKPLLKVLDRTRKYVDETSVFRGGFLDEVIRIAIVEAGSGFAAHRTVTETLIKEHNPAWVISLGFSSALTSDVKAGDICLANEICDTHGNTLPIKCTIPETKRIFVRKHVVADQHPRTVAEKQKLAESSLAVACDTTSLAVAQACNHMSTDKRTIRFLSIRSILDSFEEEVSAKGIDTMFEPPAGKKPNPVKGLLSRFRKDPELDPWTVRANEQAIGLNKFTLGIIRQLGEKLGKSR